MYIVVVLAVNWVSTLTALNGVISERDRHGERERKSERERERERKRERKVQEIERGRGREKEREGCLWKRPSFLLLAPGSALQKFAAIVNPGNKPTKVLLKGN